MELWFMQDPETLDRQCFDTSPPSLNFKDELTMSCFLAEWKENNFKLDFLNNRRIVCVNSR